MLVVTYYFTKWVEAEAYHQVRDQEVKYFIGKKRYVASEFPKRL